MANPIAARHNGDDYQARHFWLRALELLDNSSGIVNIAYDFSPKKTFDDVVITYDPPRGQAHHRPVRKHYQQVKWQATRNHRFGYTDLVDPKFIGAESVSLLERLRNAKRSGETGERYSLVTTARVKDKDPLHELVSSVDGILRLDKLSVGKGPRSKMGGVREIWRNALGVDSDEELYTVLDGFAILDGQPNLEEMRDAVRTKAKSVGINIDLAENSASDFRFDSLARELIKRELHVLDRTGLLRFLREQGITVAPTLNSSSTARSVVIRSFDRLTTDISKFNQEDVFSLLDLFEGRYLAQQFDWNTDVANPVVDFLLKKAREVSSLRLILDAHASIAFVCGKTLHLKSGVRTELIQNGRSGQEIWQANDSSAVGAPMFEIRLEEVGGGWDLAVAVSIAQPVITAMKQYLAISVPEVGKLLKCNLPYGPNQAGIAGGEHAAVLSDQVATRIRDIRSGTDIGRVHLFVAAPNAFIFYLGQQAQAIGLHRMYEYDFDDGKGGSYFPSI